MKGIGMRNLLAGGLAAAALFSFGCREKAVQAGAKPPLVKVVPATEGYMFESVSAIASVKAFDHVDLVARVEGYLIKRLFEEGMSVKKGQLLYEIEPQIYEAKVNIAEAELDKAKASQKNANIEYERQKTLVEQKATSERKYDDASAAKMEADAQVEEAAANLVLAKQNLSYTKIYSPFDGQIGFNVYSVGNLVNQSSGTLATVVSVDPMRVEFVINELDLLELLRTRDGQARPKLRVRLFFQDGTEFEEEGKISYWNNRVDPRTGTFLLQALFSNKKGHLMAGMFARVNIGPADPTRAVLIPQTALMADLAGDYVYIVGKDGKVERRDLELGYRDRVNVVVQSGLKPGESVIVEGVQKVRPGGPAAPEVDKAALAKIPLTAKAALDQDKPVAASPFPDEVTEVAQPASSAPAYSIPKGNANPTDGDGK